MTSQTRAKSYWRRLLCSGSIFLTASLSPGVALCAVSQDKAASTMTDLQSHFAACFQPPKASAGSQVTFYFSLNTSGQIFGKPRVIWRDAQNDDDRPEVLSEFLDAFQKCLPVNLDETLASSIPGKVYFLQFTVGSENASITQALLRPFGSSGYPLVHEHRR